MIDQSNQYSNSYEEEFAPKPAESSPAWMVTMADTISLILTFFVLLFAMSQLDFNRWKLVAKDIGNQAHPVSREGPGLALAKPAFPGEYAAQAVDLDYLEILLRRQIASVPNLSGVFISKRPDAMVLSLPADSFFDQGSDRLNANGTKALMDLAQILIYVQNRLSLEGHTDPVPTTGQTFASNWELSLSRAITVSKLLAEGGYPRPLPVAGLAEQGAALSNQNLTEEARFRLARRVDIVVYPSIAAP